MIWVLLLAVTKTWAQLKAKEEMQELNKQRPENQKKKKNYYLPD